MAMWQDDVTGDFLSLTPDPINFEFMINQTRLNSAGAVSTFIGTTRDSFEGKDVTHLEYESYPEMAIDVLKTICQNTRKKWDIQRISIQHKLGPCPVGEISVAIVISSTHRKDSIEAVSFAIDELKRLAPIWKKEFFSDGKGNWKENAEYNPLSDTTMSM